MILLNNRKSMIRFYIIMLSVLVVIAFAGYYYLTKLKVYQSSLNINKVEEIDTFYTRSIYGDYYFRVIDYDKDRSIIKKFINDKIYPFFDEGTVFVNGYYSELIPFKVAIGYDFSVLSKARFTLKNFDLPEKGDLVTEVGTVSEDNNVYINQVKNFREVYAKILATQDQTYFEQSFEDIQQMIREFYPDINHSINVEKIDKSIFYDSIKTSINNLNINHFKLNYFKLTQVLNQKDWEPNIATWTYGDSDITFKYRRKEPNKLLRNLDELVKSSNNEIVINTISINSEYIVPLYFKINKQYHTMTSYHMSQDGYLYVLKMRADSTKTLITTMHDFIKIAMGIYFDDKSTDKWYIQQQKEIKKYYSLILEEKLMEDLPELDEGWANQIVDFKSNNGEYPNEDLYENLKKEKEKKSMRNKVKNYFYKITD